jgi:DNA-directed RNA polymerase subunit RPC12/RpoP
MNEANSEQEEPGGFHCPRCGNRVEVVSPDGLGRCPQCGQQFLAAVADAEPGVETGVVEGEKANDDLELSELRIRNVASLRRGAYRGRSYLIIAAGVCAVAAAKLTQMALVGWRSGLRLAAIGDALFAVTAIIGFVMIWQKIMALTAEIRASELGDPEFPPDFSNLGDGSQRIADLEAMTTRVEAPVTGPVRDVENSPGEGSATF